MTHIPTSEPPIDQAWFGIWYQPLKDEIDPNSLAIVQSKQLSPSFIIPTDKNTDPIATIKQINISLADSNTSKKAYLFIPGKKFDLFGTRHGRGYGWYDRFLAACPREWLRIAVAKKEQISKIKLTRQPWDQEIDWLIIMNVPPSRSNVNTLP